MKSMTMYCKNCGAKLIKDQAYCPNCGQPTKVTPSGGAFRQNRKKFIIAAAIALSLLAILMMPSDWFAKPVSYSGFVIQVLYNQENTYLASLKFTDADGAITKQIAVIKTLVPTDSLMAGTCKEDGTMHVTSSIGGSDYPYYVQIGN